MVAVAAFLLVAVVLGVMFVVGPISGTQRQIVMLLLAVAVGVIFQLGTRAVMSGDLAGSKYRVAGSAAIALVAYLTLYFFAPVPEQQTVRIYLQQSGRPIDADFKVNLRIAGQETITKRGVDGETTITLPGHVDQIDQIALELVGYELTSQPPFIVDDNSLLLEVRPIGDEPPLIDLPPVSIINDFPTAEDVFSHAPKIGDSRLVSLAFNNLTPKRVEILLLDCQTYLLTQQAGNPSSVPWIHVRAPVTGSEERFNEFPPTTGWFSIVVRDHKGDDHFVGTKNLFDKQVNRLAIEGTSDHLTMNWIE